MHADADGPHKTLADEYATEVHRWWHLSGPSPELLAVEAAGHLGSRGIAVDLGCGLGSELAYLSARGWIPAGIDLNATALVRASSLHPQVTLVQGDATRLPLRNGAVDLLVDRGCFHYLDPDARDRYALEAGRVLRAGGRLVLRMCVTSAGTPNGLDETTVQETFGGWLIASMERVDLLSDTRTMPAVMAVLERPAG